MKKDLFAIHFYQQEQHQIPTQDDIFIILISYKRGLK